MRILIGLTFLFSCLQVQATATRSGWTKVSETLTTKSGVFFVYLKEASFTGTIPACAKATKGVHKRFATKDKNTISSIQMAFATGLKVHVIGDGNCSNWGDTETIRYFQVKP